MKKIFITLILGAFIFSGCQSAAQPKKESSAKTEQKVPAPAGGQESKAKSPSGKQVTQEEANQIALEQISPQRGAGEITKSELKDGVYNIEVKQDTIEYFISIDEKTGEILEARVKAYSE